MKTASASAAAFGLAFFVCALALSAASWSGRAASERRDRDPAPLRALAGQSVVSGLSGTRPGRALLRAIRRGDVGGVIVFERNARTAAELALLTRSLQRAARAGGNPPLLIAVDQEGGSVKRLRQGPPAVSAATMGGWDSERVAREGERTGRYLAALGVNVNLAPVLDVPDSARSFLGTRAFGRDPTLVSRTGTAFATGLQRHRVAATAKHFPGLGTATENTDRARVVVGSPRAELERRLAPFRTAVARGVWLVMVSNASYPTLDRSGKPAVFSRAIVTGLLRGRLGFRGVVVTDTMGAPTPRANRHAAAAALGAGVDLLLYTREGEGARASRDVVAAVANGRLRRERLEASYARIIALKRRLGRPR